MENKVIFIRIWSGCFEKFVIILFFVSRSLGRGEASNKRSGYFYREFENCD